MKPQKLINELVALNIYHVDDYDNEYDTNQDFMTYADSSKKIRKVEDDGILDEEIKLLLYARQTKYLRRISFAVTISTVLTIMAVCYFVYMYFKIQSMF